ncbi:helicase-related protein [Bifidobacterium sp. SO1]|uniref:helicase-related protein n=1 Tax=Bifidobacterium sp. SO1 TaxID=2809029 RepID=UPI001BDD5BFF|nr:helicase-related protein [Bifidobacterium sp. SO1]MBT1162574.1 hypothetical protein [Bifidobacterium sp. SO1]
MTGKTVKIIDEQLTVPQYHLLRQLVGGTTMIRPREQRTAQVLERKRLAYKITDTEYEPTYSAEMWLAVHLIKDNEVVSCSKRERISMTTVKHDYGFTDKMIRELLPGPMLATNPHYRSSAPMKLWFRDEVEEISRLPQVREQVDKNQSRRDKRAATQLRKQQEALAAFNRMIDEHIQQVHVDNSEPYERISEQVLAWKQETYKLRGQWDHDAAHESTYNQQRWIITYIRRHLTEYDHQLWNNDDSEPRSSYNRYRNGVLDMIAAAYPQLTDSVHRLQHGDSGITDTDPQSENQQAKQQWQNQVDQLREQITQLEQPVEMQRSKPHPMTVGELCSRLGVHDGWVKLHEQEIRAVNKQGHPVKRKKKPLYDLDAAAQVLKSENERLYDRFQAREDQAFELRKQAKQEKRDRKLAGKRAQLSRFLSLDDRRRMAKELVPASLAATDPVRYYAGTRCADRRFILHVGPTNSGKTHDALEALTAMQGGVYLAPLRLLALEVGEQLRSNGLPCSIVTGEEQSLADNAQYFSETVEMLDVHRTYPLAVVDECQMITDVDRGGAWSRAIMALNAPIIHLCMSEDALDIICKLIEQCGDTYTIIRHERQTPLTVSEPIVESKVHSGDALIVFSRRKVLETAMRLETRGIKTSVIYGALPWTARREEARRFAEHESQVLVATDAIGMGLNLPIRRIVFNEINKYDGHETRPLKYSEIKQIAGRAGRKNMFDQGLVTSTLGDGVNKMLANALKAQPIPLSFIRLSFPRELGLDERTDLSMILRVWANVQADDQSMIRETVDGPIKLTTWMEKNIGYISYPLTREQLIRLAFLPIDAEDEDQFTLFTTMFLGLDDYARHNDHPNLPPSGRKNEWNYTYDTLPTSLWDLEKAVKTIGIRFAFAKAIGLLNPSMETVFAQTRTRYENAIIKKISGSKSGLIERRFRYDYYDDDDDYDFAYEVNNYRY